MSAPTNFTESNALLAILQNEREEAERIVREMFPSERRALMNACDELYVMTRRANRAGNPRGETPTPREER